MDEDLEKFRRLVESICIIRGFPNTTKEEKAIGCFKK